MNTLVRAFAAALALAVGGTGAHADILGFGTYPNGNTLAPTERAVSLRSNGATTVTFATKNDNTIVVVTYNASCAALGEYGGYVSLRIAVDGVTVEPPAGDTFAFCVTVGDPVLMTTFRGTRQVFIKVPRAGQHSVQVFASLQFATVGSLFQSSIVIQN